MWKNITIGLVFVVCLCLVGYTGYYIGTKTAQTTIIEEVEDNNIDELTNSIKAEVYSNAYEDGYNQGKTEVFQMMLEEEQKESDVTEEEINETNTIEQNNIVSEPSITQPTYEETQEVKSADEEIQSNQVSFDFLNCICYMCNLQFNSRYELNEHCKSVHNVDCGWSDLNHIDAQGYECPACNKIFYDINEYTEHIESHYSSNYGW